MPLERRNTIATVPAHVAVTLKPHQHHSASFGTSSTTTTTPSSSSYTSIKEVIAASASASAPTPGAGGGSDEIAIRNHLVKQAAWAYLRPMSTSPESSNDHFLCRVATMVITPFVSLLRSAAGAIMNAFNCLWF